MGLFYTSYIEENKKAYQKSNFDNLDDFLVSPTATKINEDFEVPFGCLHWSLNIDKLYEELNEKPTKLKSAIEDPLTQNIKDWNDNK